MFMKKHTFWKVIENKDVFTAKNRFRIAVQKIKLPNGKVIDDYYQIHFPECILVVPVTPKNKIVCLRHYLHGFKKVGIVLPSGTIEKGELPLETAKRELVEETGYYSKEWRYLGNYGIHNNYGCGKVYFFRANNATKTSNPVSVDIENMETILIDKKCISEFLRKGYIASIGSIAALTLSEMVL